jgi:SAM-dependent methyltransferase
MQLLLGCGHDRAKKLWVEGREAWRDLVTLDMNPAAKPDILHDICDLPLPFLDGSADEIHLYDVLEHTRQQGDWQGFFAEFSEFWRILRPGGTLHALVPVWTGGWAWGDPGHRRVIQQESLGFLHQPSYTAECGGPTPTNRTDYRPWFRADFDLVWQHTGPVQYAFILQAVKPSRITEAR